MSDYLLNLGFTLLDESEPWKLESGKSYMVRRGGSFAAWRMASGTMERFAIVAAHTDSPAFKMKPHGERERDGMLSLETEVYGGPLYYSWLDRPLTIAGRIFTDRANGAIGERLISLKEKTAIIPSLAIHQQREVNEKGLILNAQEHLPALFALNQKKGYFRELLQKEVGNEKILSFDLFLTPQELPQVVGASGEMISSYRLDNLASCHCALLAIGESQARSNSIQMALFFDHEEIGSSSREGAESCFARDLMMRIASDGTCPRTSLIQAKARSLALSIDMCHGLHPNYPEKSDPSHKVLLGKGIAIKYNARVRYASSGKGVAEVVKICLEKKIPTQNYLARADTPCGSTIGPIFAAGLGIETVDVGVPQLAMHSARETISREDQIAMYTLASALLTQG